MTKKNRQRNNQPPVHSSPLSPLNPTPQIGLNNIQNRSQTQNIVSRNSSDELLQNRDTNSTGNDTTIISSSDSILNNTMTTPQDNGNNRQNLFPPQDPVNPQDQENDNRVVVTNNGNNPANTGNQNQNQNVINQSLLSSQQSPSTSGTQNVVQTNNVQNQQTGQQLPATTPPNPNAAQEAARFVDSLIQDFQSTLNREQQTVTESSGVLSAVTLTGGPSSEQSSMDSFTAISYFFQEKDKYKNLMVRKSTLFGSRYLDPELAPYLSSIFSCRARNDRMNHPILFLVEVMLPGIDNHRFMETTQADVMFRKYGLAPYVLSHSNNYFENPEEAWAAIRQIIGRLPPNPPQTAQDLMNDIYTLDNNEVSIVVQLVQRSLNRDDMSRRKDQLYVTYRNWTCSMYLSLCKPSYLQAFRSRLENRLNQEQDGFVLFEDESIREIRRLAKSSINTAERAKQLFERWARYFRMRELSLTMKLLIERTIFQNLTTYKSIYEAMNTYSTFSWHIVQQAFPQEVAKYLVAVVATKTGEYEGFSDSVQAPWHRNNFKHLGWIAIKLLAKMSPDVHGQLARYEGIRAVSFSDEQFWVTMIDRFYSERNTITADIPPTAEQIALIGRIRYVIECAETNIVPVPLPNYSNYFAPTRQNNPPAQQEGGNING